PVEGIGAPGGQRPRVLVGGEAVQVGEADVVGVDDAGAALQRRQRGGVELAVAQRVDDGVEGPVDGLGLFQGRRPQDGDPGRGQRPALLGPVVRGPVDEGGDVGVALQLPEQPIAVVGHPRGLRRQRRDDREPETTGGTGGAPGAIAVARRPAAGGGDPVVDGGGGPGDVAPGGRGRGGPGQQGGAGGGVGEGGGDDPGHVVGV